MKTGYFYALAFVATLFTSTLSANVVENTFSLADATVKISAVEKSIIVDLGAVKREVISIVITDAENNVLLSETVKKSLNFIKRYNMSKLEAGKYTLTVTKKTIKTVQPFEITQNSLDIIKMAKNEKFIPVVSLINDKLDVNVLLKKYGNITVTIFDNQGHLITKDKNVNIVNLHKRYNVAQLSTGIYVVEINTGEETFYETVKK